jgi:hypothetical protein
MRKLFLTLVLGAVALGLVGLTPSDAQAQRWRWRRGYSTYYYPSVTYYTPGYSGGYYSTPGYSYYTPGYTYGYSSYYTPGYSTYYSAPVYSYGTYYAPGTVYYGRNRAGATRP